MAMIIAIGLNVALVPQAFHVSIIIANPHLKQCQSSLTSGIFALLARSILLRE
jgi:hypothetical protein